MQNPFQTGGDNSSGFNDPLSFVRKLWGDMQLPGMVTPSLSVDELDKQIRDLKTVESWLNINMNMLRASIQALEVQRATITALKAMGESFAQQQATRPHEDSSNGSAKHHAQWPMHNNGISEAQADAENLNDDDAEDEDEGHPTVSLESKTEEPEKTAKEASTVENVENSTGFASTAAWWNVLQEQFKHALGQALKDEDVPAHTGKATRSSAGQRSERKAVEPKTSGRATQTRAKATTKRTSSQSNQAKPAPKTKTTSASKADAIAKTNPTKVKKPATRSPSTASSKKPR